MYTRCPVCQTLFRIQPQQLKAARGQVRCGECQTTFDALQFLVGHDELAPGEQRATAVAPRRDERQHQLPFSEEVTADAAGEELSRTPEQAAPEATTAAAETAPPLETELPASPADEQLQAEPVEEVPLTSQPAPSPAVSEELEVGAGEEVVAEAEVLASIGDELQAQNLDDPPPAQDQYQPRYALPEEAPPPHRSFWSRLAWGVASLLLLAVLAGQLAVQNRDTLAGNPLWRPWLERLCAPLHCTLPVQRDLAAIEMIERTVLSHPKYQKALLITATLINKAPFAQPYPEVELTMTNLEQKPVAHRRFLPSEYLSEVDPQGLFPAGGAVRLRLEIADPGDEAVGFEFDFH